MTKYILLGLFGVVASLGLALGLLVGTEAGSRWVLGKVPGLEVTDFQGAWRAVGRPAGCAGPMVAAQ